MTGNASDLPAERKVWQTWLRLSADCNWDRKFFLSGETLGLAPSQALAGDIIVVPLGCCLPMVFRPVGEHFINIGEAYVVGYMYGKGINMWEAGEVELKQFKLR